MMDRLIRQIVFFAPAAVMSAWATVMLHTLASGHLNRLLSPVFRSYVPLAAIVLLILSALYLLLYQPTLESASVLAPRGRFRQILRWLVLLLPVLAASILSPSALSSTTLANRTALDSSTTSLAMPAIGSATQENVQAALAADPNQPVPMEVTDLISVSHSSDQIKNFEGRRIRTVGLFAGGNSPKLVRWIMWCCAADALPASVKLSGQLSGNWKDEQWLEVTGMAQFPSTLGRVVPEIKVEDLKPAAEPDEPYLSP